MTMQRRILPETPVFKMVRRRNCCDTWSGHHDEDDSDYLTITLQWYLLRIWQHGREGREWERFAFETLAGVAPSFHRLSWTRSRSGEEMMVVIKDLVERWWWSSRMFLFLIFFFFFFDQVKRWWSSRMWRSSLEVPDATAVKLPKHQHFILCLSCSKTWRRWSGILADGDSVAENS